MSTTFDDRNRQIIPRWYDFNTACVMGDIQPNPGQVTAKLIIPGSYAKKKVDWQHFGTLIYAIDLVGSALIAGDFNDSVVEKAAAFITQQNESVVSSFGIILANIYLHGSSKEDIANFQISEDRLKIYTAIAKLKQVLRMYPRNAIAWADQSFYYAILGQVEKAEGSMQNAIAITKDNRFVLRASARCFLHLKQPDKALYYLRASSLVTHDPWVISSEISIAEGFGLKPRLVKKAKSIVDNKDYSPWSLSELAGTLSTLEAQHGSAKKAKKLLKRALADPNENTMAQAEWLASGLRIEVNRPPHVIQASYEADARALLQQQKYDLALSEGLNWQKFQPFSARPAVFASYLASVCLRDNQKAIEIVENAKISSPHSILLNNNHAFALASLNEVEKALNVLSLIDMSSATERDKYTIMATEGLVKYRQGDSEKGRNIYKDAISGFKRINDYSAATIATFFLAREDFLAGNTDRSAIEEANKMAKKYDIQEILSYITQLTSKNK